MALFDRFRKTKKEKANIGKVRPAKGSLPNQQQIPAATASANSRVAKKNIHPGGFGILHGQQVTEKSSMLAGQNIYLFLVNSRSNKILIRQAVENRYGVRVVSVRVAAAHGKERRLKGQIGWKPGFKKAFVKLAAGQSIETQ